MQVHPTISQPHRILLAAPRLNLSASELNSHGPRQGPRQGDISIGVTQHTLPARSPSLDFCQGQGSLVRGAAVAGRSRTRLRCNHHRRTAV